MGGPGSPPNKNNFRGEMGSLGPFRTRIRRIGLWPPHISLYFPQKPIIFLYFFKIPTPDLADYGPEGTWDQLNPVRRTLLYRHFARRAHHLPPDPNILNAKTKKVKK